MEMNGILIGVKLLERFSNSQRQKIKNSFTFRAHALYVDGGYVSVNQISKKVSEFQIASRLPFARQAVSPFSTPSASLLHN